MLIFFYAAADVIDLYLVTGMDRAPEKEHQAADEILEQILQRDADTHG